MKTLETLLTEHDLTVLDHLDQQVTIPVVHFGRQGDVIVVPDTISPIDGAAVTPVPKTGLPVVRGENGGNTHLLIGDGPIMFDPATTTEQVLGTLTVPVDSTAYLQHPEHGAIGFTPGNYTISRQREQADQIRLVTD